MPPPPGRRPLAGRAAARYSYSFVAVTTWKLPNR